MTRIPLTGPQIAVLVVLAGVSGVVGSKALVSALRLAPDDTGYIARLMWMSLEALALVGIPVVRKRVVELLAVPVPRKWWGEVALVAVAAVLLQFASAGADALERWWHDGDAAIARLSLPEARSLDKAFSAATLRDLAITSLLAPVLEEIVFRGLLFEEWRRTRRVATAMILSSAVFALCHLSFSVPFAAGLLLCAIYVRTGALRAAIFVHFIANAALWYPLLGQFVIPASNHGIGSWWFNLV